MNNDFYVYLHLRKTDNKVFYVGKGRGRRAHRLDRSSRSDHWNNVANKHGVIVEILFSGLSEEEAYQVEVDTIAELKYFNEPLVNHNSGGYGGKPNVFTEDKRLRLSKKIKEYYETRSGPNLGKDGLKYWTNPKSDHRAWVNLDSFWIYYNELGLRERGLSRVYPEISRTTFKTVVAFFDNFGNPSENSEWIDYKSKKSHFTLVEKPFLCKPKFQSEIVFKNIETVDALVKQGHGSKYVANAIGCTPSECGNIVTKIRNGWDYKTDIYVSFMIRRTCCLLTQVEYLEEDDE